MSGCVIPIARIYALRWAAGDLSDRDLAWQAPLVPEAIFIVSLPDLASYRAVLGDCARLHQGGATLLIARTGNPLVAKHIKRRGGLVTCIEAGGKERLVVPPGPLAAWIAAFGGGRVLTNGRPFR